MKKQTINLERYATIVPVHRNILQDAKFNVMEDLVGPLVAYRFEVELLKDTHGRMEQEVYWMMPDSWWDHFKWSKSDSRWLGWLAQRFGVKHKTVKKRVKWEASSIFPESRHYPEKFGRRVKYVTFSEEDLNESS